MRSSIFFATFVHHVSSFETYLSIVNPQQTRFLCRPNTHIYVHRVVLRMYLRAFSTNCVIGLVTMSVIVALFPSRQSYTHTLKNIFHLVHSQHTGIPSRTRCSCLSNCLPLTLLVLQQHSWVWECVCAFKIYFVELSCGISSFVFLCKNFMFSTANLSQKRFYWILCWQTYSL